MNLIEITFDEAIELVKQHEDLSRYTIVGFDRSKFEPSGITDNLYKYNDEIILEEYDDFDGYMKYYVKVWNEKLQAYTDEFIGCQWEVTEYTQYLDTVI